MGGKRDVLLVAQNALSEFSLKFLDFVLTILVLLQSLVLFLQSLVLFHQPLTSAYSQRAERTG